MATVLTSDEKLEKLKIEILKTFEDLSNYLSIHKQKLLSRLIRFKEGYDKNTELNAAIEQLRIMKNTGMKVMKSNLLESITKDFDNRLKLTEYCREEFEKFTTLLTSKKCRNWPVFEGNWSIFRVKKVVLVFVTIVTLRQYSVNRILKLTML